MQLRPRRSVGLLLALWLACTSLALAQEARRVVEAEAEVPRAMAEAFRSGNLGIMDYYRMKNLQADTDMRGAIATGDEPSTPRKP